jgi:CubicO group peptidase (beta-lactamase class C family)/D-alanyl-D-alanine dipeptidase
MPRMMWSRVLAALVLLDCAAAYCWAGDKLAAKYAPAVRDLKAWVEKETAAKQIPALSLALVDDQTVVWCEGFGYADADKKTHAGPHTVFRIGSVSKPITALLLMLFVEQGKIDLDAPVSDYLPDFRPTSKSGKKITLRQALSHRTGLVREPPVGGYFDDTNPSLADTVKSLNQTALVYEPESMTSYSNAAPCLSGVIMERLEKEPFAKIIKRKLFDPLGMTQTGLEMTPALRPQLSRAVMGTYHGRDFAAPTFELATGPAGNVYSTPLDQAKLLSFLFAGGKGMKEPLLKLDTLEKMWQIQFAKAGDKVGFGLGFHVSDFDGKRRIGHGGAVYGFATEFAALPDQKLGVVAFAARDVANGVTRHIADAALRHMLAVRDGKPLPALGVTEAVGVSRARSLAGHYRAGDLTLELVESDGRLWVWPPRSGMRFELRKRGNVLLIDDIQAYGAVVVGEDGAVVWSKQTFDREPAKPPLPLPMKWEGLIGEYGPNHNHLTILEKDGVLHALIEWVFLYPLEEVSENVFKFPNYGLYHGHPLVFHRDAAGQGTVVEAANYHFKRRPLPRSGETFKLTPLRPIDELRKTALAAEPPKENNVLLKKPDLVDVTKLDSAIKLDIRYATANNFLGAPLYTSARAFLQRPAAEALVRVNKRLEKSGYGVLVHDAYRPWHVTKMFRDAVEPRFHHFVADPLQGSRHNRGCAVDLTLYERSTGKAVEMAGGYDEFTDRSYPDYVGGTSLQRMRRDLLRRAMEDEGFAVYAAEWWHFDFGAWRNYPILNLTFENVSE